MESRLLAQAIATWTNGAETVSPLEKKQVLQLCRDLPAHLRQAQNALWDRAVAGLIGDFEKAGTAFLAVIDEAIGLLRRLAGQLQNSAIGTSLADLERLRQEHQEALAVVHAGGRR